MDQIILGMNIDDNLLTKLEEIVPELRKDIQDSVHNRLMMKLERIKQAKRLQMQQIYQKKLQSKIQEANITIKDSLSQTLRSIDIYKKQKDNRHKQKIMTEAQERNCIEQTVQEILSDQMMVQQAKARIRDKLQIRVRTELQHDLEENLQKAKRQMIGKLKEQRDQWTEQRIDFWKRQSDLELKELANQHNQLNNKKASIEDCLNNKKIQKNQLQQTLRKNIQHNALIASLRSQLKFLKTQIN